MGITFLLSNTIVESLPMLVWLVDQSSRAKVLTVHMFLSLTEGSKNMFTNPFVLFTVIFPMPPAAASPLTG